jgi:peptidyl-tRNA hydrolase, PTH1 family
MNLVVGLGNPGKEYLATRHNVGWQALDVLVQKLSQLHPEWADSASFRSQPKWQAEICQVGSNLLLKPQTFMNNSGQAVQAVLKFYKLDKAKEYPNLFVIHDDLDLNLGAWKLHWGTGPKVHNGLQSLYQHLGTKNFWHVRIGVDDRQGDRSMPGSAYVLQSFSGESKKVIDDVLGEVADTLIAKLAD